MTLADAARDLDAGGKSTVGRWELGRSFPRWDYAARYYRFLAALGDLEAA